MNRLGDKAPLEPHAAREELGRLNAELEERVRQRTASLTEAIAHLEEFSYTVSHDLRAPARAMRGYAEIALKEYGSELASGAKEYLERIVRGGARMDRLVQDVLTYSRATRRELTFGKVDLEKLVQDIIDQSPEMQGPRARVEIRRPLEAVHAHEASLGQALSNLLENAVKFVRAGELPRAVVRTERRGSRVPELILLDLKLPLVGGFEVLEWMRGQAGLAELSVVILTGSSEERDKRRAHDLGVNGYYVKPPDEGMLREMLEAVAVGT